LITDVACFRFYGYRCWLSFSDVAFLIRRLFLSRGIHAYSLPEAPSVNRHFAVDSFFFGGYSYAATLDICGHSLGVFSASTGSLSLLPPVDASRDFNCSQGSPGAAFSSSTYEKYIFLHLLSCYAKALFESRELHSRTTFECCLAAPLCRCQNQAHRFRPFLPLISEQEVFSCLETSPSFVGFYFKARAFTLLLSFGFRHGASSMGPPKYRR
jgi:hypothetical protein